MGTMSKFIEVRDQKLSVLFINKDSIEFVKASGTGTKVYLKNYGYQPIEAYESLEQVRTMLMGLDDET